MSVNKFHSTVRKLVQTSNETATGVMPPVVQESFLAMDLRVREGIKDSQKKYNELVSAIDNSANISRGDPFLNIFINIKSDVRAILSFHSQFATRTFEKKKLIAYSVGSFTPNAKLRKIQGNIAMVEEKYDISRALNTRVLAEIMKDRDDFLYDLCCDVFEDIGSGYIVTEERISKVSLSKGLCMLMDAFCTLESLGHLLKKDDLSLTDKDLESQLTTKRYELQEARDVIAMKDKELFDLRSRILSMSSDNGRLQLIMKQQDTIASLDSDLLNTYKEIETLRYETAVLTQDKASLTDQLGICKAQLKSAIASYENDVRKLQPVIEEYIQQSHLEHRQIAALRSDFGLSCSKILQSERAKAEALKNLDETRQSLESVSGTQKFQEKIIKKLEDEIRKQTRLKLAAVAAKKVFEEDNQKLNTAITNLQEELEYTKGISDKIKSEMAEMEKFTDDLLRAVQQAEQANRDLNDKLAIKTAELAAQELFVEKIRNEPSPHEDMLIKTQKLNLRLQQQLKAASLQISELTFKLDELKEKQRRQENT